MGHALMENRHLLMDFIVSQATGTAERDAVPELLDGLRERSYRPRTLGTDRGYDTKDCVGDIRARRVTPHVAQKKKHSALDGRTTRHASYAVSLRLRKRVEEVFGWMKNGGRLPTHPLPGRSADRPGRLPGGDGLQSGPSGQAPGRAGGRDRAVRMSPPRFCAPARGAKEPAGPPKPAPWDRAGGFRNPQHRFRIPAQWRRDPKPILQQPGKG